MSLPISSILGFLGKILKPLMLPMLAYFQGKKTGKLEISEKDLKEELKDNEVENKVDAMSDSAVTNKLRKRYTRKK